MGLGSPQPGGARHTATQEHGRAGTAGGRGKAGTQPGTLERAQVSRVSAQTELVPSGSRKVMKDTYKFPIPKSKLNNQCFPSSQKATKNDINTNSNGCMVKLDNGKMAVSTDRNSGEPPRKYKSQGIDMTESQALGAEPHPGGPQPQEGRAATAWPNSQPTTGPPVCPCVQGCTGGKVGP